MKEKRNIRKRLLSLLLTALMLVSVMIQPVTVMAVEPAGVRTESAETEKSGEPGETSRTRINRRRKHTRLQDVLPAEIVRQPRAGIPSGKPGKNGSDR